MQNKRMLRARTTNFTPLFLHFLKAQRTLRRKSANRYTALLRTPQIRMLNTKDYIEKIREALDAVELSLSDEEAEQFAKNYDALELPAIISAIVDYLQPELHPYEAAIYWYAFRHSIVLTGQQYVRMSTRGLMEGVVQSSSGQSSQLSYASVQNALSGLVEKSALSQAGNTTREGTLYKVHLPEEIPICQRRQAASAEADQSPIDVQKELDYYNVAENRQKVFERDGFKCHYCEKQLTRFTATLDHLQPVSKGGDNSYGNLITACLHCNSRRRDSPLSEFLSE